MVMLAGGTISFLQYVMVNLSLGKEGGNFLVSNVIQVVTFLGNFYFPIFLLYVYDFQPQTNK